MSLSIKIVQTNLDKEPMPLRVILGNDFLYGSYDEGWRLIAGERGEHDFVAYMPMQLGRGIMVQWSEDELESVNLKILLPTAPTELRAFYEMVVRIADYWNGQLMVDESPMDIEEFIDNYGGMQMFNQNALNEMAKSIIKGENSELTLFSVMWPLVMGKSEAEAFIAEPAYFSKWLHDKQNIDAYFSKPAFYRSEDGILGRYAISERMRCIVPIRPYVPYGFDDPETDELIVCENFGMLLFSAEQGETIGEMVYEDFVKALRSKVSKKVKRYDGNHLIVEELTAEEFANLLED